MTKTSETLMYDVAIAGGGLAGLSAALACAHEGLEVVVIDGASADDRTAETYDGRASAIAYANFRMLERLGVGQRLSDSAQRIEQILVSDGRAPDGVRQGGAGPAFLHFDRRELDTRTHGEPLGYMVENRLMRQALLARIAEVDGVHTRWGVRVSSVVQDDRGVTFTLSDGTDACARVGVAADGASSRVRGQVGLTTHGWSYDQHGLVATVRHREAHHGIAHEYFLPSGPFAILPLTQNRANLVWTERAEAAEAVSRLDDATYLAEVRRRFGGFLGAVELDGPRWSYPLALQVSERMVAGRVALLGDAARRIHPIAGQGFNLGLKDAAALAETLGDAARVGLDPGAGEALDTYERWRRSDGMMLALATDAFNRLYSNDNPVVRLARNAGMAGVNRVPALRRLFTRDAGADLGELPRLLQA